MKISNDAGTKALLAAACLLAVFRPGEAGPPDVVPATKVPLQSTRPPAIDLPAPEKYIPFPAMVFHERKLEHMGDRLRMTFTGTWHNLAPQAVSYALKTHVMPRRGQASARFHVTGFGPAGGLRLERGAQAPFSLTVEAAGPVEEKYSELVFLYLVSEDVKGLWKPYLMCASNGFLGLRQDVNFSGVGGSKRAAPKGKPDPRHVIPTRETLGYRDGTWERDIVGAFNKAIATSPEPIINQDGDNLTDMAKRGVLKGNGEYSQRPKFARSENDAGPLFCLLGALRFCEPELVKRMMLLLSDEFPFYPVGDCPMVAGGCPTSKMGDPNKTLGWIALHPMILPGSDSAWPGTSALGTYILLVQRNGISDEEHFRFLHNVILPSYLIYRSDFRLCGRLTQALKKGDSRASLSGSKPFVGAWNYGYWLIVGSGESAEWLRCGGEGQVVRLVEGPTRDHAAGEPWFSYYGPDWLGLENEDPSAFMCAGVASRDSAVAEQCADMIADILTNEKVFRFADGSFANEPGTYGWFTPEYPETVHQTSALLGVRFSEDLRRLLRNALFMWNEFPFSNGTHPMLNQGGGGSPLSRVPRFLDLFREMYPEEREWIAKFERVVQQEEKRKPGSLVDNWSWKIDGWGYAMLRGPGAWDRRMETLLSSKHLLKAPGDHVSHDCLGICLFAHGANMSPRYGYDWRGYPDFLLNRGRLDAGGGGARTACGAIFSISTTTRPCLPPSPTPTCAGRTARNRDRRARSGGASRCRSTSSTRTS